MQHLPPSNMQGPFLLVSVVIRCHILTAEDLQEGITDETENVEFVFLDLAYTLCYIS